MQDILHVRANGTVAYKIVNLNWEKNNLKNAFLELELKVRSLIEVTGRSDLSV